MNILKKILFLILLITCLFSIVAEDLNNYEYIKVELDKTIDLEISRESKSFVNDITVNSIYVPNYYNESLYINKLDTNYDYNYVDNTLVFTIDGFESNNLHIEQEYILESTTNQPEITSKAVYKIKNNEYTEFSDLIDINNDIRKEASELITGEDDLFIISMKVAEWVNENVEYDLKTISANPNMKSSWVYENKKGVCKEITNLFVSMMRSLGIPSRVVIGYAYTDDPQFNTTWGGHAWAEVLMNGEWVPFDITYRQYGYIDASHLSFLKIINYENTMDTVNINGYGIKIKNFQTEFTINLMDQKFLRSQEFVNIDVEYHDEVKIGSKSYFEITVENLKDYYKHLNLKIAVPEELEIDQDEISLTLLPDSEQTFYINYEVDDSLDDMYIYTFPVKVYNNIINEDFILEVSDNHKYYNEKKIESENISYISIDSFKVECDSYYRNNFIYECTILNLNKNIVEDYTICFEDECYINDYLINDKQNFTHKSKMDKISFSYGGKNIRLFGKKPLLDYSYMEENNSFILNYSIVNFNNWTSLKVFVNKNIFIENNISTDNIKIPLEEGDNKILIKLLVEDEVIDSISFEDLYVEPKKKKIVIMNETIAQNNIRENNSNNIENNDEMSFFETIKNFLLNIYEGIFG